MKKSFCLTVVVCAAIIAMIFSGCASTRQTSGKPEAAGPGFQLNVTNPSDLKWPRGLEKEFMKYWTLRYTDQFEAAYDMEAPRLREALNFAQYRNYVGKTSTQKLLKMELTQMNTSDSFEGHKIADVGFRFHLERKKGSTLQSYIEDKWLRINGQWFHGLRNPLLFPNVKYE